MNEHIIITLSSVFGIGIFCQWIAWRVKLPAIIFLLLAGIIAGPLTGWLKPDVLFGDLLFPFVSLSVAVILFEGSLTLKFHEIAGLEKVVRNLVSVGVFVTWLTTSLVTRLSMGFSWEISFLFGALTVVTGPTVIVPILRTVRPKASIANILRWEGIVIDPVGASLAVLVYEFIISGSRKTAFGYSLLSFTEIVVIGILLGGAGAYLFGLVIRRHWIPEYLQNVSSLSLVFVMFAFSNHLHDESGLVTVTVMGVWLANMKDVPVDEILDFKESLSILLISVLFIVLAARMEFARFYALGSAAVVVLVAIQFLARPINVMISAAGSGLTRAERFMLSWIAPRGIIAAAISSLFAIRLESLGFPDAGGIVPLTFAVIIGTVLLQSTTAGFIARWLKVAEPEPKGFLIIGANSVAREIAKILELKSFRALLADTNWDNIVKAKMEGLSTYYGNPVSEHADRNLDLVGIGRMLALSPHEDLNIPAVIHYRMELGANTVFALQTKSEKSVSEKMKISSKRRGKTLFGKDITYAMLASMLAHGGEIHSTKLTESFSFKDYRNKNNGKIIPMFAIDDKNLIHIFTADNELKPAAGWSVISMLPSDSSP